MNSNEATIHQTLMKKVSTHPIIIVDWLDTLPISKFWEDSFSNKSHNYIWKLDNTTVKDRDWIMGIFLNCEDPKITFTPIVAVTPEVHEYIKTEIYKYEYSK